MACTSRTCCQAAGRRYKQGHRQQVADYNRSYHEQHRDELLEYKRQYREEHREAIAADKRRSEAEHPEKGLLRVHKRRSRIQGV